MGAAPEISQAKPPTCNVCGGLTFQPFRRRITARCADCGSMERTKLLKLILDQEDFLKRGQTVFHAAPEPGIGRFIKGVVGDGYEAYDLNPRMFPADLEVRDFDLITDTPGLPSEKYDIVLHSHVMEHLPCDIVSVMWHLHRSLKPDGKHIFCVPILPGYYASDFGDLTPIQRNERFSQFDHVRRFGALDFDKILGMAFNLRRFDISPAIKEKFESYAIPANSASKLDSNTFFILGKEDLKLR